MGNTIGDMVVAITGDTSNFNLSIDQASKKFDSLTTIIAKSASDMSQSFKKIDNEAKLWGNSTDLIRQKQMALKNEMTSLMSQGFDPLSPKIQSLKTQYSALEQEANNLSKTHVTLKSSLTQIDGMVGGYGSRIIGLIANPYILAATAIIAAIKTFTDLTHELVAYGAQIQETSERTGLSTKALQEYKFIAEQTGGSLETITAAVKMMTRGLETNKDTFAKLGIQTKDLNGNFLSTSEIFTGTIKKLGDLSNDTERTNLALKLFGRGALDMVPLLKEGSKGIEELTQKANELGLVLNDSTIRNAHDFEKSTDALKASWKAFSMSLVQDALPALKLVTDSYLYVTQLINRTRVAAQNNEIIKAYRDGKASVVEYHDAIQSMIDLNKQVVNDDKSSASEKRKANQEIADGYSMLTKVRKEYRVAEEEQIKRENQIAKDNAATKALQDEEDRLQSLRDARDKATKEYNDSIKLTSQLQSKGLRTTEEATKEVTDATKKYAEALAPIVAASGSNKIGAEALQSAKDTLDKLTQAENIYNNDKKAHDEAILARANTYAEVIKKQISDEDKYRKDQTDKYNKEVSDRNTIIKESSDNYDKLKSGELRTFAAIETAKTKALKSGAIEQVEIEKAANAAKINLSLKYFTQVLDSVSNLLSKIQSLYQQDVQNQLDAINSKLTEQETAIDIQLQKDLEAAGVADLTNLQSAQKQLKDKQDALAKETDAEKKAALAEEVVEAKKAVTKATLEQKAVDDKKKLEQQAALDTYEVQKSAFKTNQALSIASATVSGIEAVLNSFKTLGWPLGLIPAGIMTGIVLAQIAIIKKQVPPTKPTFAAEGGIFPATPGGINTQLAEAGQTEVVFPLDKLESFLNQGSVNGGSSDIPINMTIQLDSQTLYSGIFAATRNKTVLISAKAVV